MYLRLEGFNSRQNKRVILKYILCSTELHNNVNMFIYKYHLIEPHPT